MRRKWECHTALFCIGGALYNLIEVLWRGYTHWTMFLVGGLCFRLIGIIHTRLKRWNLLARCSLCSVAVTTVEFVSGCIVNLQLRWNVWDYSGMPLNLCGQVCLLFSGLWGLLSLVAFPLYRFFDSRLHRLPVRRMRRTEH